MHWEPTSWGTDINWSVTTLCYISKCSVRRMQFPCSVCSRIIIDVSFKWFWYVSSCSNDYWYNLCRSCCTSIIKSFYVKIYSASYFTTFFCGGVAIFMTGHFSFLSLWYQTWFRVQIHTVVVVAAAVTVVVVEIPYLIESKRASLSSRKSAFRPHPESLEFSLPLHILVLQDLF
jgi:hypothetical protein